MDPIETITAHIPSMSEEDETEIVRLASAALFDDGDVADLALRTCACGASIDGFYGYADHLIAVFGGESHLSA